MLRYTMNLKINCSTTLNVVMWVAILFNTLATKVSIDNKIAIHIIYAKV
jgi:hypothetical protein